MPSQNAVRAALGSFTATSKFESELLEQLYNEEKNNTIVVYTTSVNAVRQTFEDCSKMLKVNGGVAGLMVYSLNALTFYFLPLDI